MASEFSIQWRTQPEKILPKDKPDLYRSSWYYDMACNYGLAKLVTYFDTTQRPLLKRYDIIAKISSVALDVLTLLIPIAFHFCPLWLTLGVGLPSALILMVCKGKIQAKKMPIEQECKYLELLKEKVKQNSFQALHSVGEWDLPLVDRRLISDRIPKSEKRGKWVEPVSQLDKRLRTLQVLNIDLNARIKDHATKTLAQLSDPGNIQTWRRVQKKVIKAKKALRRNRFEDYRKGMAEAKILAYVFSREGEIVAPPDPSLLPMPSEKDQLRKLFLQYQYFGGLYQKLFDLQEHFGPDSCEEWSCLLKCAKEVKEEMEHMFLPLLNSQKFSDKKGDEHRKYHIQCLQVPLNELDEKILTIEEFSDFCCWIQQNPEGAKQSISDVVDQLPHKQKIRSLLDQFEDFRTDSVVKMYERILAMRLQLQALLPLEISASGWLLTASSAEVASLIENAQKIKGDIEKEIESLPYQQIQCFKGVLKELDQKVLQPQALHDLGNWIQQNPNEAEVSILDVIDQLPHHAEIKEQLDHLENLDLDSVIKVYGWNVVMHEKILAMCLRLLVLFPQKISEKGWLLAAQAAAMYSIKMASLIENAQKIKEDTEKRIENLPQKQNQRFKKTLDKLDQKVLQSHVIRDLDNWIQQNPKKANRYILDVIDQLPHHAEIKKQLDCLEHLHLNSVIEVYKQNVAMRKRLDNVEKPDETKESIALFEKEVLNPLKRFINNYNGEPSHCKRLGKALRKPPAYPFDPVQIPKKSSYLRTRKIEEKRINELLQQIDREIVLTHRINEYGISWGLDRGLFLADAIFLLCFSNLWITFGISAALIGAKILYKYVNYRIRKMEEKKLAIRLHSILRDRLVIEDQNELKRLQEKYDLSGMAPTWSRVLAEGKGVLSESLYTIASKGSKEARRPVEKRLLYLLSLPSHQQDVEEIEELQRVLYPHPKAARITEKSPYAKLLKAYEYVVKAQRQFEKELSEKIGKKIGGERELARFDRDQQKLKRLESLKNPDLRSKTRKKMLKKDLKGVKREDIEEDIQQIKDDIKKAKPILNQIKKQRAALHVVIEQKRNYRNPEQSKIAKQNLVELLNSHFWEPNLEKIRTFCLALHRDDLSSVWERLPPIVQEEVQIPSPLNQDWTQANNDLPKTIKNQIKEYKEIEDAFKKALSKNSIDDIRSYFAQLMPADQAAYQWQLPEELQSELIHKRSKSARKRLPQLVKQFKIYKEIKNAFENALLENSKNNAYFLFNQLVPADQVAYWRQLPKELQDRLVDKQNAYATNMSQLLKESHPKDSMTEMRRCFWQLTKDDRQKVFMHLPHELKDEINDVRSKSALLEIQRLKERQLKPDPSLYAYLKQEDLQSLSEDLV